MMGDCDHAARSTFSKDPEVLGRWPHTRGMAVEEWIRSFEVGDKLPKIVVADVQVTDRQASPDNLELGANG